MRMNELVNGWRKMGLGVCGDRAGLRERGRGKG